jgi:type II secretory pathway component PulM
VTELWARVRAIWESFSPREQLLVAAVGALFAATFVFFALVSPVLSAKTSAAERVESAERDLEVMVRLRREYETINNRLAGVEQRIRDNRDQQNTLTLLESLASGAAVKIDSMEERKSPDHELYRETRVEVSLKKVTLAQVVSLLHSIEASPREFSVKGLRFKTRPDKDDTLEVAFTVSSFEAL